MSKIISIGIAGLLLLTGCAQVPKSGADSEATEIVANEELVQRALNGGLSEKGKLLYLILSAEVAGQRGQFEVALDGYMEAAEKTVDPKVAERATQIALLLKDDNKVRKAVSLWVARDPGNLSARKISAVLALKAGSVDEAKPHLDYLLQSETSEFESALLEAAKIFSRNARKEEAYGVLDQLTRLYPERIEVPYIYSLLAIQKNDFNLALEKVESALEMRPNWEDALALQAQIVSQIGNPEQAKAILWDALQENPQNTHFRMMYAQALIRLEEYEAAGKQFKRIIAQDPEFHDARFALALLQLQMKQDDRAYKNLEKLTNVSRWQSQAVLYLGRIEAKRQNYDEALTWFDKATDGPVAFQAGASAVSLLINLNRFDEAQGRLIDLKDRFPGQVLKLTLIEAELLNAKKDYQGAFEILTRLLNDMPGQAELLYTRALVAERLDMLDVLEADLTAILEKEPDNVNALNALGYTLADRTERYEEAARYLERAIKMKPDDPVIMDSYGWLQYRLGNYETALEYLKGAYEKMPDAEIAAHLGEVLWVIGKKVEAKKVWGDAMEKAPEDDHLRAVRERFKEAFQ
ncbi:MAG: tetratricopeptide repeat protein [Pseudomonadota bacterium]